MNVLISRFHIDHGFLTLEDFKRAFSRVAPRLPERTVLEAFRYGTGAPTVVLLHSEFNVEPLLMLTFHCWTF